jgi:uncharacterized membrane protein
LIHGPALWQQDAVCLESGVDEVRVRKIYTASLLLKGFNGLLECIAGLALAVAGAGSILSIAEAMTRQDLIENPNDIVARTVMDFAQNFTMDSQHFFAFYLFAHGLVKVVLVVGLLRNWHWAYPAAMAAFSFFIVYQLYRFTYTHAAGLIILTIFDMFVLALILHEYRLEKQGA